MLEKDLQAKILRYLEQQPQTFCIKTVVVNQRGIPDILICHKGRLIYVEVKKPEAAPRVTQLQRLQQKMLESAGAVGFVTNDYKHFVAEFTKLTREIS